MMEQSQHLVFFFILSIYNVVQMVLENVIWRSQEQINKFLQILYERERLNISISVEQNDCTASKLHRQANEAEQTMPLNKLMTLVDFVYRVGSYILLKIACTANNKWK